MIPAAGRSLRLNAHKALCNVEGMPAIYFAARAMARAHPQNLCITLPNTLLLDTDLCTRLQDFFATVLPNKYPSQGYMGSIKTAILERGASSSGILVSPVDSPIFNKEILQLMVSLAQTFPAPLIIVPYYHFKAGHPIYCSKDFFPDLKDGTHKGGLRELVAANKKYAHALFCADARILYNLNTKTDWQFIA